jgi:hypothetical protein
MGFAKTIILRPIDAAEANATIRRLHYSGKVVRNSQLHIGVFYQGALEGALQFGPSMDKRRLIGLVRGTAWHQFVELNRLAFSERLPRNSESRALAIACRLLQRHAPQVKWIVTFADATQCGDGTIYRAAGFLLTGLRKNNQIWAWPDGTRLPTRHTLTTSHAMKAVTGGAASMKPFAAQGARPVPGFQIRYIRFLDATWLERLTVPVLPYTDIQRVGASMYRGRGAENGTAVPTAGGGEIPTRPLHS